MTKSCARLPSKDLRNKGTFLTTLRRLRICVTRCEAGLEEVVGLASDDPSWEGG